MLHYIKDYNSEFKSQINHGIMNKKYDDPLYEYVVDAWKSLEILKNIEIINWEYSEDESNIDINRFIIKRDKKKKKKDRVNYKYTNDSRYAVLTIWIKLTVVDPVIKNGLPQEHQKIIKRNMLIPIQDKHGYFLINGKKYMMIYQMVDKSLYSTASTVTLKSLMPICIKRESIQVSDVGGTTWNVPLYQIFIFKKAMNILLFYVVDGFSSAFTFLGVSSIISFINSNDFDEDAYHDALSQGPVVNLYFRISASVLLEVNKEMFDKYPYIKAIVGMVMDLVTNRFTMDTAEDCEYWIKKLGANNLEKGKYLQVFFTRLLDHTTIKTLKLEQYDKKNIYCLVRWILMNFNKLRLKDNLSLENKRLRCNEYIASLLTKEFSKRLNRVIALGNKATMVELVDMFNFSGDILFSKMHASGVLRFDDNGNDLDLFSKFKWTKKGPNSLGANNNNNVSMAQRDLHPSYLGLIDIIACGNSDPGQNGLLSPFSDLRSLYFNDDKEPDDFIYDFRNDVARICMENGYDYIDVHCNTKDEYYSALNNMDMFTTDNISAYGVPSKEYEVVLEDATGDDVPDDDSVILDANDINELI